MRFVGGVAVVPLAFVGVGDETALFGCVETPFIPFWFA